MKRPFLILCAATFAAGHPANAEGLSLSGGLDTRTEHSSTEGEETELRGLFQRSRGYDHF